MKHFGRKEKKSERPKESERPRGVVFVDTDNLMSGIVLERGGSPDRISEASIIGGFDNLIKRIAREFGEIVEVFALLPPQRAYVWGVTMYRLGFYSVVCPRVRPKGGGEEQDTVDETLIKLAESLIDNIKNLSFICLVSGDKDFSPMIRKVIRRGLKIIVVAASKESLSGELIDLADSTYLFEPTEVGLS